MKLLLDGHRYGALGVAAAVVLSTTGLATGATHMGHRSDARRVFVDLADAGAIINGNDVRLHGVKVGSVSSVKVVKGKARLALDLIEDAGPLHRDAVVRVRPVSLLGERFVEIEPGTAAAPLLEDGDVIPASQSSRSVDLDEVLNAVDAPTGKALQALVTGLGEGVAGQGGNTRDALKALSPALSRTDELVAILDDQNSVLTTLIDDVTPVMAGLDADGGKDLDALMGNAGHLLAATSAQQEAMAASLQALPATLKQARSTLAVLSGVADQATPALHDLRPVTSDLAGISRELEAFGAAADPALASLTPVLARAQTLLDQTRPLVAELQRTSPLLVKDTAAATELLTDYRTHLRGTLNFLRDWGITANGQDGLSNYFRAVVAVEGETATTPVDAVAPGVVPPLPKLPGQPAVKVPGVKVPAVKVPALKVPALEVPGVKAPAVTVPRVGGLLKAPTTTSGPRAPSATGLTPQQESNLLGFLLGGTP
ncbi:MAG: Mammalian cell entry related domain protein [Frankiales bacterium]|nr:Mammalian cell entry related domain protein [Frankiales bacterium]